MSKDLISLCLNVAVSNRDVNEVCSDLSRFLLWFKDQAEVDMVEMITSMRNHSHNTSLIAKNVAGWLIWSEEEVDSFSDAYLQNVILKGIFFEETPDGFVLNPCGRSLFGLAAYLHDIAKPKWNKIYELDRRLTQEEMIEQQAHTTLSSQIIENRGSIFIDQINGLSVIDFNPLVRFLSDCALEHHERLDGSGYPRGLKASEISFAGKFFAVIDVLEALMAFRPYKAGIPLERTIRMLEAQAAAGQLESKYTSLIAQSLGDPNRKKVLIGFTPGV